VTILDEILEKKRAEVDDARARMPQDELEAAADVLSEPTRGLADSLLGSEAPAVIAELKRQSPSKGVIRADFDPVSLGADYEAGGAAALSVLTDGPFFGGKLQYLAAVRQAVTLPLLRKDFIIDPYQLAESRLAGADAVLLIVAALSQEELAEYHAAAGRWGLEALVEVHDEKELEVALEVGATLVGVNNRDLRTFEVDLAALEKVAGHLAGQSGILLVAESGIHTPADIARLENAGARAFLVGESLMRRTDVADALRELRRRE